MNLGATQFTPLTLPPTVILFKINLKSDKTVVTAGNREIGNTQINYSACGYAFSGPAFKVIHEMHLN